jgi:hypothetical protein
LLVADKPTDTCPDVPGKETDHRTAGRIGRRDRCVRRLLLRPTAFLAAVLALAGCESSPRPPSSGAPLPAARATAPAGPAQSAGPGVAALPADTAPLVSPDSSVRRARANEASTGRAPLASECAGDACGAVAVTWLEPGYRFENTGHRDIAIEIWFAAQGDCLRTRFSIAPAKTSGWGNLAFCPPYHATYK